MKGLVYLFALYVLLLSGIPCSADDGCCMDEAVASTQPDKRATGADQEPCRDCSPFFACGAYHGVTIPDHIIHFPAPVPPVTKLQYFYNNGPLPDFSPAIWQPPKTA